MAIHLDRGDKDLANISVYTQYMKSTYVTINKDVQNIKSPKPKTPLIWLNVTIKGHTPNIQYQ